VALWEQQTRKFSERAPVRRLYNAWLEK